MSKKISAIDLIKTEQKKLINNTNDNNSITLSSYDVIKLRINQHKKTFYMDDELFEKWKRYEGQQLIKGKKITFQGIVENFINDFLKTNLE